MPVAPAQRERLRDDLRGILRGEVLFDDLTRALYSTDASIFEVEPLGVVTPADEADLQELVRFCHAQSIPLIARGAGTGLAGEALGRGLIIDLSRHFRSIIDVGADTVRVQPGVVLQQLNARLAQIGRRFAPDPSSAATCTIGGMMATDASGSRILKHGYTRDHVVACRAVLDNGDAVSLARHHLSTPSESQRMGEIVAQTAGLLDRHASLIAENQPATPFDRCGYRLAGILQSGALDLPRLLVGSEGTLAIFTEATLRTIPLAEGRAAVLFCCVSLDAALRVARLALPLRPAACELLDRRLVSLARSHWPEAGALVPVDAEALVLVEFEAEHRAEAQRLANALVARVHHEQRLTLHAQAAVDPAGVGEIWRLRDVALPSLYGLGRGARPVAFVEDIGVPPDQLGMFLTKAQDLLQAGETTASFLAHAATGQVHIRPFLDLENPEHVSRLGRFADALYDLVRSIGGTISTQHGTGIARTPWVPRLYGLLYPVFRELKSIWDPNHVFNPGKIVAHEPLPPLEHLRRQVAVNADAAAGNRLPLLVWSTAEVSAQVEACNGCGHCRLEAPPQRMCPLFRVTHAEEAAPRAKANLLRRVLNDPDPKRLTAADVRAVADLCINCKMCAHECPAHVNIPKLMLEAKAAHFDEHGLDRSDWVLARMEGFARFGSRFALFVNPLLKNRAVRWLVERLFGISRRRKMPSFAWRSFLEIAAERGWTARPAVEPIPPHSLDHNGAAIQGILEPPAHSAGTRRVAYFVDVFANYNDPSIAEAAVAVLHHNGVKVFVPSDQWGCGMAPLAQGDIETAREYAQKNLRVLGELARDGWRIVCSEPTAALMLRQDYLDLVDDPDAHQVSAQTVELCTFLWELHEQGQLRTDFAPMPLSLGHHVPCHLKALGPVTAPRLLELIPGLHVQTIDVSCSGMAGTFGLKREQYHASLDAGRPMLEELRRPRAMFGSSECSACRMQMDEGSGKRSLHPVQYLAIAYGLMPGLASRLQTPLYSGAPA